MFFLCATAGVRLSLRKTAVATQCHGSVSSSHTAPISLASHPRKPSGSSDGPETSRQRMSRHIVLDSQGPDLWLSPWYSLELHHQDWEWVFTQSDKPSLTISSLEALAVVIRLKLFFVDQPKPHRTKVPVMPTWTDNRGNGAALNKLMSTRFLASAVIMELACYLKRMSIKALVEWAPREANREADELANGDHHRFDPSRRIPIEPGSLR